MTSASVSRCVTAVVLLATMTPTRSHAQATDITWVHLREEITDAAAAGRLPRLDSTALEPGVRREIRVYTGLGLGSPNHVTRLWQDDRTVHGRFGVFWRTGYPSWVVPSGADSAQRAEFRKSDASLRKFIDSTYGCRGGTTSRGMNVCWLDARPGRESWVDVLAQLDSVGVDSVRMPREPKMGFDGWMIVVEVRTRSDYHAYWFWYPESSSTDPGERAAAQVAAVLRDALDRRLEKR